MAETILTTIATDVLGKLTSLVFQEIGLAWGVKTELKKLNNTMLSINAVLLDAELQQTKSHAVKLWLERLKDVVYDINDVLDDFSFEVNLRKNVKTRWGMLKEVRNFFSKSNPIVNRLNMGHKMKELRERFDEIASNRNFQIISENVVETQVQTREGITPLGLNKAAAVQVCVNFPLRTLSSWLGLPYKCKLLVALFVNKKN